MDTNATFSHFFLTAYTDKCLGFSFTTLGFGAMSDDEIQPNLNPPADGNGEGAPADMEKDDPLAGLDATALIAEMRQRMAAMDAHQASMERQLNQVRGHPLPVQPSYADATAERNPELLRVQLDSALERNEQLEADIRALRRENLPYPSCT